MRAAHPVRGELFDVKHSSGGMMDVGWSFEDMVERWPSVTGDLIAYFATMHVLTEIANAQGGTCD